MMPPMYSAERIEAEQEWKDFNSMLDAKESRVLAHQRRIDLARESGIMLDEEWGSDRSGARTPGFHLTARGQYLGGKY